MSDAPEPVERRAEKGRAPGAEGASPYGKSLLIAIVAAAVGGALVIVVPKAFREGPSRESLAPAALAIETRLRKSGRAKKADDVARACASIDCGCARVAAERGLDADVATDVLGILGVARICTADASFLGLRAEALARDGAADRAQAEAEQVLAKDPDNAHALYAIALLHFRAGRWQDAAKYGERASASGRGAEARLLSGLVAYQVGDLDAATREFQTALELDPDNLDAVYNLALVSQRRYRYREAREGYLKVANLDPTRKDARYNLAVLAHSIGAKDEAMHHLAKLESIAPGDEKTTKLKTLLAAPTAPGASSGANVVGTVGVPPSGKDIGR